MFIQKSLCYFGSAVLLLYAYYYFSMAISSGDHWKFVETTIGVFLAFLLAYWTSSLGNTPKQREVVTKRIRTALLIALAFVGLIVTGYIMLIGIGFSADSQ